MKPTQLMATRYGQVQGGSMIVYAIDSWNRENVIFHEWMKPETHHYSVTRSVIEACGIARGGAYGHVFTPNAYRDYQEWLRPFKEPVAHARAPGRRVEDYIATLATSGKPTDYPGFTECHRLHKEHEQAKETKSERYRRLLVESNDAGKYDGGTFPLLDIKVPFTLKELTAAFNVRALQIHPDQGGTTEAFVALRKEYASAKYRASRDGAPRTRLTVDPNEWPLIVAVNTINGKRVIT